MTLGLGWWAFDLLTMTIFTAGFAGGLLLGKDVSRVSQNRVPDREERGHP